MLATPWRRVTDIRKQKTHWRARMWRSSVKSATWFAHAAVANQKSVFANQLQQCWGRQRTSCRKNARTINSKFEQCIPGGEQGGRLGFRTADLVEEPAGLRASPKESDPAAQKYWEQVVQKYWGVDACFKHICRL